MRTAVILLWAGCLWAIARGVCCLIWTASPWRRILTLAVLALAASCAHCPLKEKASPSEEGQKR